MGDRRYTVSDSIDELVADAAFIAREAEARTAEWIDRCYQSEERALKAEAMCEWLAERIGVKAWMSLTGITRKALGGDDEATRAAFVAAEAKSQLEAAREAVKHDE